MITAKILIDQTINTDLTVEELIEILTDMKDWEYLIHHIHDKDDKEVIHHCRLYDHKANLFIQEHLVVNKGVATIRGKKVEDGLYHVITGLEETQEVCWSDDEATKAGIKGKRMLDGMTKKEKAKEW